jgi:signal transduction histidine kinase
MSQYLVSRANALVFGVLIAILLLVGGITWHGFSIGREARLLSQHTYNVLGTIKDLGLAVRDAESGQRGYLLTGNDDYLAPYHDAVGRAAFLSGELQRLTADNPAEQERLRALAPILQHKLEELAQTVQLRRDDGLDAAMRIVRTNVGRGHMKQITAILADMTSEEQSLLAQRLAETDRRGAWVRWLVGGGTVLSALTLLWAARMLNQAWARSYRTEAEQRTLALRLRTSLDSLSQGIAVFDRDRQLTHWNDCFQALLALPKAMVRSGMPYAACAEHTAQAGVAVLETEEQVRHGRRTPGEPVTYECSGADGYQLELRRTTMPDGGFVLTVTDMTKRAQAEGVLRESQKMQAIGQLTGGIAHDFNNLLTVILGNLELATDQTPGQPALQASAALQACLDQASWAAQRGAVLTAQLLSFARKQVLAPAAIDLAAAMPNLVPLLRRTLGEHIEIHYVETPGLWPAMADPAQLESALLNLALNARDAMPDGGRLTIELANKVLDEEYARHHGEVTAGEYAMLAVSDTGHGMAPDVVARVFEPFFTTKGDAKGTGLGLAMVFGFVKQSGGHAKVYSEPGEGTTIRLYLPRAVGTAMPAVERSTAPVELPRGSATVLVVEDDAAVRKVAVTMLRGLGYRVLEAADGEQALRVFGDNAADVDLLLTDVVLPGGMRGRDVAQRVNAIRPQVKVLYMSGYAENSIIHNGRLEEGVQLIGKPFRREQLARKVAEVIGDSTGTGQDANVVELTRRRGT